MAAAHVFLDALFTQCFGCSHCRQWMIRVLEWKWLIICSVTAMCGDGERGLGIIERRWWWRSDLLICFPTHRFLCNTLQPSGSICSAVFYCGCVGVKSFFKSENQRNETEWERRWCSLQLHLWACVKKQTVQYKCSFFAEVKSGCISVLLVACYKYLIAISSKIETLWSPSCRNRLALCIRGCFVSINQKVHSIVGVETDIFSVRQ